MIKLNQCPLSSNSEVSPPLSSQLLFQFWQAPIQTSDEKTSCMKYLGTS